MDFEDAFREAIKYNAAAIAPTLVGFLVAMVFVWVSALGPFLSTLDESGLEAILAGEAGFTINGLVLFVGVGLGYVIHRVGRTTLLFKLYGDVLLTELEQAETPEGD